MNHHGVPGTATLRRGRHDHVYVSRKAHGSLARVRAGGPARLVERQPLVEASGLQAQLAAMDRIAILERERDEARAALRVPQPSERRRKETPMQRPRKPRTR